MYYFPDAWYTCTCTFPIKANTPSVVSTGAFCRQ